MIDVGNEIAQDFEQDGGAEGDKRRGGSHPLEAGSERELSGGGPDPEREQRDEDPEPGGRSEPEPDAHPDHRVHQVHGVPPPLRSSLFALRYSLLATRYATAYCSVTSRPAGRLISRNSSRCIIGSSRTSSSSPLILARVASSLGSSSKRYRATSGWIRTERDFSRCSCPTRRRVRSSRRVTTSGRKTRPEPLQVGQSVVIEA